MGNVVSLGELVAELEALRRENEKLREQSERLEQEVMLDELTGLYNRRGLNDHLLHEMARAEREGTELSVAFLDLNDFKNFNDAKGHEAGDKLLQWVANAWKRQLRSSDILGRRGGDEFAVILPNTGQKGALEKVSTMVERTPVVTASYGVVRWLPGETMSDVWARADQGMYQMKRAGREPRRQSELATASKGDE